MRVLIDLTQVPVGRMGVGSYAENLLNQFSAAAPGISFTVVLQSDDAALRAAIPAGAHVILIPARLFRMLPARLLFEQCVLPMLAWRNRIDVLHSLHYSFPLMPMRAKRLVTMHDMTSYLLPHMHTRQKGLYMRTFIRLAVRYADFMIFVSASALDECRKWFDAPVANASVVHHGKSPAFQPAGAESERAAIRERYSLPERYLLYLGTLEPRKNIPLLLRSFASVAARHPDAQLVIAGKKGWHFEEIFATVTRLQLEKRVRFTGYIDEQDKPALIRGATIFVYPSLHEGFGIPVLEAMACGVPTVAGNRTSIPEVAGEGACLVDPESESALADAIEHLYTDRNAREQFAARGLAQAAHFSWQKTAEETAAVYRSLAHQ